MPVKRLSLLPLAALLALATLAGLPSAPAQAADGISSGALYDEGPTGRHLLGGQWLLRTDPQDVGEGQRFQRQTSESGWQTITVPKAWNVGDDSNRSMSGGVAWYRKDFRLPSSASGIDWVVRFESVNYRAKVWLNGRLIGRNTGAYLPFEVRLPAGALRRGGENRLVIRTDSRRTRSDLPPSGRNRVGVSTGGWWNYGGLLREVYLRRVDRIDLESVRFVPNLPCRTCDATVDVLVRARNLSGRAQPARLAGAFGGRAFSLGTKRIGPGRTATFTRRLVVRDPRLWSPEQPSLYTAQVSARAGSTPVARYDLKTGIRSVKVSRGRMYLNGRPVNFRGVALHEDDRQVGLALDAEMRRRFVDDARDVGATVLRSHYPLHPHFHEMADRLGLLVWSEIPVYQIATTHLARESVQRRALGEVAKNIEANGNHPSIFTWSMGNELSARPGPAQGRYFARAAKLAKAMDPTRLVSYAVAGYPAAGCQPEYGPLDILGINEYFGWYPGPNGQIADRESLSEYLDSVRACYRDKAIVITEFGAEANRSGPVEEKGTYEHQQDFVNYHHSVFATKPWLSGVIYWALKEFRVRPAWDGGNPRPQPPIHQKGVVAYDGSRKPAFFDLQRAYRAVDQYPGG